MKQFIKTISTYAYNNIGKAINMLLFPIVPLARGHFYNRFFYTFIIHTWNSKKVTKIS